MRHSAADTEPVTHSGPIPDSVWHTQKLPAGYALTAITDWENALGDGGKRALLRRAGTTIDTVDLTFGVVSVGKDSLVFLPVRTTSFGEDSVVWYESSPTEHVLWTPSWRRELREQIPFFHSYYSSPIVTQESIIYYWGIARSEPSTKVYAMRYNFRTAGLDSAFLELNDLESDSRFYLSEPEVSDTEVAFGGHRLDRTTWLRIPNAAPRK